MLRGALTLKAIDRLAGEGLEVLLLALPEQKAADEVVEEDSDF